MRKRNNFSALQRTGEKMTLKKYLAGGTFFFALAGVFSLAEKDGIAYGVI
jgi:hypothetical protein